MTGTGTTPSGTGSFPTPRPVPRRPVLGRPVLGREPRSAQRALVAAGLAGLVPAAVLAFLRLVPPADDATALAASFIPYGAVPGLVAVLSLGVALLRARRRAGLVAATLLALVVLAAHLTWQAPLFVPDGRQATGPGLTLLSLNTLAGRADPDQVVAAAADADVVVLVEMTSTAMTALDQRGWRQRFPYTAGASTPAVTNTVVFSRYPLADSAQIGQGSFDQWLTTVAVPELGPLRLAAVHPCNPYCGSGRWTDEHARLEQAIRPDLGGRLVVAGDFNAVADHGPMLRLHRLGLRSATDLLGAGWLPTYPANRAVPPLLAIDHVLVSEQLTATAVRRVAVAGSDHLGLLTTVAPAR